MNVIYLHGSLKQYGAVFRLEVDTVREAFIALTTQIEGFDAAVRKGAFRIVRRKQKDLTGIDETTLDLRAVDCRFDIYPAMVGGKSGLGKILLGVAIIGLAIVTSGAAIPALGIAGTAGGMTAGIGFLGITYGTIATFGAMMALGGLAMMFAPSPKAQSATAAKNEGSYILNGPVNSMAQGGAVPLVYGKYLTGSVVISSSLTIDQLLSAGATYSYATAYSGIGYPNYPYATSGVGGTGVAGSRSLDDIYVNNS